MRVLLVEDDELIAQALRATLAEQHYTVDLACDGLSGWEYANAFTYDLILLDVMLPKLDGISLCRQLRSQHSGTPQHSNTPILLLTSRDHSADKVQGLDAGADDYIVKPIDFQELSARIRAILRRGSGVLPTVLEWGQLHLNPSTCEVTYSDTVLNLTPKEYAMLELFLRNNQRVFSRRAILDHLWSFEEPPAEDTVRAHIKGLRSKLKLAGASPDLIETVYGLGYRLKQESKPELAPKPLLTPETRTGDSQVGPQQQEPSSAPLVPTPSDRSEVSDAIAKVWERFKDKIHDRVTAIEEATTALSAGKLDPELKSQAEREAHKLVGSLGTFGLSLGSQLAREIERFFHQQPEPTVAPHLWELIARLRQLLHESATGLSHPTDETEAPSDRTPLSAETPGLNYPLPMLLADERPLLLIVDSDRSLTKDLVEQACKQGLRVEVANHVEAAREACHNCYQNSQSRCPEVVFLDLSSSVTYPDGEATTATQAGTVSSEALALLAELSNLTPPVPVIVSAVQGDFTNRLEVARLGGRAFLQKPISPMQAIEVVMDVLRRSQPTVAKVMMVDDDPQMLTILRTLLEPWGIRTIALEDPRQFWKTLEAVAPDLLVLDIEMPYLSGIELCQVVRSDPHWSGLPVLFLTAHTDPQAVHQVFATGADDYVSKPVVGPELVTRILNRLERSQLLRQQAETDPLTGVANRRRSTQDLSQFLRLADANHQPLCFALLDLDCFKQVNDRYGHATGDAVLRRLGELLAKAFRSEDVVARWGGEEFVVGMYGLSKYDGLERLTDFLTEWRAEEFTAFNGTRFRVTLSAGIAEYPTDVIVSHSGGILHTLYQAADGALYQAKIAGRDRVAMVNSPLP
ncbi:MAG: response regulator [Actinomycetota bacterium]